MAYSCHLKSECNAAVHSQMEGRTSDMILDQSELAILYNHLSNHANNNIITELCIEWMICISLLL